MFKLHELEYRSLLKIGCEWQLWTYKRYFWDYCSKGQQHPSACESRYMLPLVQLVRKIAQAADSIPEFAVVRWCLALRRPGTWIMALHIVLLRPWLLCGCPKHWNQMMACHIWYDWRYHSCFFLNLNFLAASCVLNPTKYQTTTWGHLSHAGTSYAGHWA